MAYKIIYDNRVYLDLDEALEYYLKFSKKTEASFYDSFKNAIKAVKLNPYYQIRYGNIRCFPLKKFPFLIHF
jgi:toxin ParE1/3/4